MRLRHGAAVVLGLVTLIPALTACEGDVGIAVGDRIPARADDQFAASSAQSSVKLPLGRLEFSLGEATRSLSASDTRQREPLEAPAGTVFLPITWQYDASTFGEYAAYLDTKESPVIDLVSDGAKYRLPAPETTGEGSTSFYVLVAGTGKAPKFEVGFDGVTQEVDLVTGERVAGDAQPLYDLERPDGKARSCRAGADFELPLLRPSEFTCSISPALRLPYAGSAWAAQGHEWLVLTVRTSMRRYDQVADDARSGTVYVASTVASTFLLGTLKPAEVIEDAKASSCPDTTRGGCNKVYHLIFDVSGKTKNDLTIEQDYGMDLYSVWGSGKVTENDNVTFPVTVRTRVR